MDCPSRRTTPTHSRLTRSLTWSKGKSSREGPFLTTRQCRGNSCVYSGKGTSVTHCGSETNETSLTELKRWGRTGGRGPDFGKVGTPEVSLQWVCRNLFSPKYFFYLCPKKKRRLKSPGACLSTPVYSKRWNEKTRGFQVKPKVLFFDRVRDLSRGFRNESLPLSEESGSLPVWQREHRSSILPYSIRDFSGRGFWQ